MRLEAFATPAALLRGSRIESLAGYRRYSPLRTSRPRVLEHPDSHGTSATTAGMCGEERVASGGRHLEVRVELRERCDPMAF